jgi:hypothetical protein
MAISPQQARFARLLGKLRELPAFGGVLRLRLGQRGLRCCRNGAGKLCNRCQQFPPMPEQDADVPEILRWPVSTR